MDEKTKLSFQIYQDFNILKCKCSSWDREGFDDMRTKHHFKCGNFKHHFELKILSNRLCKELEKARSEGSSEIAKAEEKPEVTQIFDSKKLTKRNNAINQQLSEIRKNL